MTANESTTDDGKESIDKEAGTLQTRRKTVDGAYAAVQLADLIDDDASINVTGHGLDDEPSVVTLRISGGVSLSVSLDADDAAELADAIATTAARVEGWEGEQ